MLSKILTILLAFALSIHVAYAADYITFCNELTLNESDKKQCMAQDIVHNACVLIPDSNAKGDTGSSAYIFPVPGATSRCRLYENEACDPNLNTPSSYFDNMHYIQRKNVIYRSYKCFKT